jgi:hypothetical protein
LSGVRAGPYAPAILRFQISFPDTYPSLPPLVTFSTDMFHPLITPLTTYMYSTDVQDGGTASAFDEERLPPGGFSLRHGFPGWFGRGSRAREARALAQSQAQRRSASGGGGGGGGDGGGGGGTAAVMTPPRAVATATGTTPGSAASGTSGVSSASFSSFSTAGYAQTGRKEISTYEVLRYIRSTFDNEDVLDSVPLEAAGNPGAWHAWRTHRRQTAGKALPAQSENKATEDSARAVADPGTGAVPAATKRPDEWNWEGVWEERVKRGIAASLSEGVLYGNAGTADEVVRRVSLACSWTHADVQCAQIHFLSMEDAEVEGTKSNLLRTLGATA